MGMDLIHEVPEVSCVTPEDIGHRGTGAVPREGRRYSSSQASSCTGSPQLMAFGIRIYDAKENGH